MSILVRCPHFRGYPPFNLRLPQLKTRAEERGVGGKTHQLDMGDVFLPPQVFLDAGSEATEGVVGVHHHVNDCVY